MQAGVAPVVPQPPPSQIKGACTWFPTPPTVHDCTQLHNLSYLSGEHNCTRFPTSGQGYFLRQRHGVHHLLFLITAPEPSQPLCLEQQSRNNLLQSTYHQVARSEIAPQSNGSCPIICPRLWSASCSDATTRRKVDFARYGVNSSTTKSQLGHYSPPTNELPSPLPPSLPYTWNL